MSSSGLRWHVSRVFRDGLLDNREWPGHLFLHGLRHPVLPGRIGIYVLSDPLGDTDEFDDDVLWHEFGHFVDPTTHGMIHRGDTLSDGQ